MRFIHWGIAAAALASSGTANAGLVGYCHAIIGNNDYYFTNIIDLPENSDNSHLMFERFIENRVGRTPRTARCYGFSSTQEAEQMRNQFLANLSASGAPTTIVSGFPPAARQEKQVERVRERPKKPLAESAAPAAEPVPSKADERAAQHAAVEARNRAARERYEAALAEQKRQVEQFEQAKQDVARRKEAQRAAAQQAIASHDAELAAHAETVRQHEAEVAAYERQLAAQKLLRDFDERHKLGKASTDTDANVCVTAPETKLNASFQGNTAASVLNGCGQPVDVMICLMTDTGWKCGATYGLESQKQWSFSSFKATGQVFSDARVSGSSRPLAKPN